MEKRRNCIFCEKDFSTFKNVEIVENFLDSTLDTVDNWGFYPFFKKAFHISHNHKCGKLSFRHFWTLFTILPILGKIQIYPFRAHHFNIFVKYNILFVICANLCNKSRVYAWIWQLVYSLVANSKEKKQTCKKKSCLFAFSFNKTVSYYCVGGEYRLFFVGGGGLLQQA